MEGKQFAIVLPSWLYNNQRAQLAQQAFNSLAKTDVTSHPPPLLLLLTKPASYKIQMPLELYQRFNVVEMIPDAHGTEQTLAWGTNHVFAMGLAQYVIWMGDDALFNPDWLNQLSALIDRHPEAKAWTVYRSAHTTYHKQIGDDGVDIETQCICGHGFTISAEEWATWGIDWRVGHWPSPAGDTLDLHHSWARLGSRWCTRQSYVQHTGKVGVHCTEDIPEYAIDFVGENA